MRILNLRFKNLNSLEGDWNIDFTDPQFQQNGLFVITGQTGSGKTTILDAITLAMYGRTPRLQKVNKTTNDIMTQGCGDCLSEVTFSTVSGTYRSLFSQRRARGLASGALQDQRREIVDVSSGKILASTVKEADAEIENISGMTYEQFTKSVMLAQGQFAAFLQAGSDQRAPILEQITGTGIYSEISIAVQQRFRDEKEKLTLLQAEVENLNLLTDEEIQSIQKRIEELKRQSSGISRQLELAQTAQRWFQSKQELDDRQDDLQRLSHALLEDETAFVQDNQLLQDYEKARPLVPAWTELGMLSSSIGENRIRCTELEKEKAEQSTLVETYRAELKKAETGYQTLQAVSNDLANLLKRTRALDGEIIHAQEDLAARKKTLDGYAVEQTEAKHTLDDIEQLTGTIKVERQDAQEYLKNHASHELLNENQQVIINLLDQFKVQTRQIVDTEQELHRLEDEYKDREGLKTRQEHELQELQQELEQKKAECDSLRQRLEALAMEEGGKPLHERLQIVTDTLYQTEQTADRAKAFATRMTGYENLSKEALNLKNDLDTTAQTIEAQRKLILTLEKTISAYRDLHDLADYRKHLVDGSPCPLCGSPDHPYADHAHMESIDADVSESENQLAVAKRTYDDLLQDRGRLEARIQTVLSQIQEDSVSLQDDRTYFSRIFSKEPLLANDPQTIIAYYDERVEQEKEKQAVLSRKLREYDSLEKQLADARKSYDLITTQATEARTSTLRMQADFQQWGTTTRQMKKEYDKLIDQRQSAYDTLVDYFDRLHLKTLISDPASIDVDELKSSIQRYARQYQHATDRLVESAKRLAGEEGKMEGARRSVAQCTERLEAARKSYHSAEDTVSSLKKEREELFSDKNCDQEEDAMRTRLHDAEEAVARTKETFSEAMAKHASLSELLLSTEQQLRRQESRFTDKDIDFTAILTSHGFRSKEDFQRVLIPEAELARLQAVAAQLRNRSLKLENDKQDMERLVKELEERHPSSPYDESSTLRESIASLQQTYDTIHQQIGSFDRTLAADMEQRTHQETAVTAITSQRQALETWSLLNTLIGSSEGKKFRNYAQGITFDVLLSQANRKLISMTDRYLLVRSQQEALDIAVIDNYQGGEIRSTKNLSGGESFLISLALALGLSQMASKQVRVDSLFLDEGFGTLDSETLDTALDALSSLRDDGKLIGLISHVQALRERITTQIHVVKGSGGRSTLQGPGCRELTIKT